MIPGSSPTYTSPRKFEHIELDDNVISDIIVRKAMLRRCPADQLTEFVCDEIKPMMSSDEILHLDLKASVTVTKALSRGR